MTEAQRHTLSRVLFALALPACFLMLIIGWDSEAWRLAYPVGMAFAWAGWWVAPASEKTQEKKGRKG